jgi:hypothetical protein
MVSNPTLSVVGVLFHRSHVLLIESMGLNSTRLDNCTLLKRYDFETKSQPQPFLLI